MTSYLHSERERDAQLVAAIAAHRKVNPDGYRMSGRLTVIEEDAMKAALAAYERVKSRSGEGN